MDLIYIIILLGLIEYDNVFKNYKTNPQNYRCTIEQLKIVAEETRICSLTSYSINGCFNIAKISQCDFINKTKENKNEKNYQDKTN